MMLWLHQVSFLTSVPCSRPPPPHFSLSLLFSFRDYVGLGMQERVEVEEGKRIWPLLPLGDSQQHSNVRAPRLVQGPYNKTLAVLSHLVLGTRHSPWCCVG